MSFMTPRRWAFSEMLRGLKRDGSRSLLSLLLAALALSIPLFIALVFYGLSEPLRSLPMSVELTVFAKDKAPMDKLESDVKAMPWVASTQIIPRDEALKGLNEKLGLPQRTGSNPLPDILIVTLSSDATSAEIEDVAKRIEALSSVDFVPYEASWHAPSGPASAASAPLRRSLSFWCSRRPSGSRRSRPDPKCARSTCSARRPFLPFARMPGEALF